MILKVSFVLFYLNNVVIILFFNSRQLWFSEDGSCLLGAGGDGLQVLGWEPTTQLDVVPASWGQIYDMTVANNELV